MQFLDLIAEWLFHFTCHQDPDLLVNSWGLSLPFCYRCGGIYLGIALALPSLTLIRNLPGRWYLGLGLITITLCEWLLANLGQTSSTFMTRAFTGLITGVGLVLMLSVYVDSLKINLLNPLLLILLIILFVWLFNSLAAAVELTVTLSFLLFWVMVLSIFGQKLSTIVKREFLHG